MSSYKTTKANALICVRVCVCMCVSTDEYNQKIQTERIIQVTWRHQMAGSLHNK